MHTSTTERYTLSLHDALPISADRETDRRIIHRRVAVRAVIVAGVSEPRERLFQMFFQREAGVIGADSDAHGLRSEEHTSELQSHSDLVCRLLLEKKNKTQLRN